MAITLGSRYCWLFRSNSALMKKFGVALLSIVGVLVFVILIRAAGFRSRQIPAKPFRPVAIDRQAVVQRLSEAIRFKTVSSGPAIANTEAFTEFGAFITRAFPNLTRKLIKETVAGDSLLFTWPGKNNRLKPILLLAHTDVVPVEPTTESSWHYPPFSGEVADGYVWGRGAIDDKSSVLAILEAVDYLLSNRFEPERTVYLAFGHDEEVGGNRGAANIAALLRSRHVELESIFDEGLNIFSGVISGASAPVALVGIAEKGYLSLQLSVETSGGHSSMPPDRTAIGVISGALQRLQAAPFPARLSGPTRSMFEFLGPEMGWQRKLLFANLWLFGPLVKKQLAESPVTNALLRTTLAPTMVNAGIQDNVLPSKASAVVNLRVMPGESIASAIEHVRHAIADPAVKITSISVQAEPSAVTDIEAPSFRALEQTIRQIAPSSIVAPALLIASTDSRHYRSLSQNIFRFLPVTIGPDDIGRYHGIDERIAIEDYERCIRFYAQLIINSNQ
jgi:carboxypeptidase PM20D1